MAGYEGLRDRDYFHIMLNLDSFEGFRPTAKALAERFLDAARRRQDDPGLEPELRAFPYSRVAYGQRLDEVYQGLVEDVERYEARRSWTLRTREDVIEWLRQMAPFNQTDGAWLRTIAPIGPMDEVRALLFRIFADELGNGDPELNHANVYTDLLASVDIELPDIRSREYADNPDILDSAYTLPLFQLAVSEFPQDYLPEILGMTQYLEWSSVELRSMVLLHEHLGLDPHYYELHVAIDNAAAGHGAMARRAVELYLEQVRVAHGERAMQEQWARVWNGYVAFATTGTLGADMAARRTTAPTPAERVAAIVRDRAAKGSLNHGAARLGDTRINDLFADPDAMMAALVSSGMIVPGSPETSPFFELLTVDGPMFRIFDDAEVDTWRAWTRSLATTTTPATPGTAAVPATGVDPGGRMRLLVDTMRSRQEGEGAHRAETLEGPDPADPAGRVSHPVAWWFQQPATALMRALADKDNGWVTPGSASTSRFVTELLAEPNGMSRALRGTAPGGGTWIDVVTAWIDAGCPVPDDAPPATRPLTLLSPAERVAAHPTGQIHGSGSVH
jgi:hypothetical protein